MIKQHFRHRETGRKTCVLYDQSTGIIHHVQHVVMEGNYEPTEQEVETLARWALERRERQHRHLRVLHLTGPQVMPLTTCTVDVERQVLVRQAS